MKSLKLKLLIGFSFLYGIVLAGLGIVIGQLFTVYVDRLNRLKITDIQQNLQAYTTKENIDITSAQANEMQQIINKQVVSHEITSVHWYFWLILTLILIGVFALLLFLTERILKKTTQSIDHVAHTALELAQGNYHVRAYESADIPSLELSQSVNKLARNIHDLMVVREVEQERLKTLINNMGSALIMISKEGEITVSNDTFLKLFDKNPDDVQKHVFRDLGVDHSLEEFVDHVFMTEEPYRKQLKITIGHRYRHMEVYGAPVIGTHGHWLGVVIVMHDITELKNLEQVRKDFVANVSHELRTPITSIKGFSETLLDGAYKDEETLLSFLNIMYKESNRIQVLVQDLLELSKIEREGFQVDLVPTSLNALVKSGIEKVHLQMEEKAMNVIVEKEQERDVIVLGEANRLIQVIVNLLANAITYSTREKTIKILLTTQGDYGVIQVQDEGIGMSEEEIPRVFERFYRVDRARSRNSGGTGLGLAIVKHLIEAHNGRILVESKVGKGTVIRLLIPLAK